MFAAEASRRRVRDFVPMVMFEAGVLVALANLRLIFLQIGTTVRRRSHDGRSTTAHIAAAFGSVEPRTKINLALGVWGGSWELHGVGMGREPDQWLLPPPLAPRSRLEFG